MRRRVRNRLGDEQLRHRIIRGADGLGTLGWCPACETIVSEGPDACLGYLPGVSWACCGHGGRCPAYVVIGGEPDESCAGRTNYETLRGDAALRYFAEVLDRRPGRAIPDTTAPEVAQRATKTVTPPSPTNAAPGAPGASLETSPRREA